jgi:hypothetical protein
MDSLPDKLRTVAAYHGSVNLSVHAQHVDEVVRLQRAALLEAADRLEQLEAEAARLRAEALGWTAEAASRA